MKVNKSGGKSHHSVAVGGGTCGKIKSFTRSDKSYRGR